MQGQDIPEDRPLWPALALAFATGLLVSLAAAALFATPSATIIAVSLLGLIAGTALWQHARRRPRPPFGAANGVTLCRAALVAVLAAFAADSPPAGLPLWWIATGVAAAALLLDGVDGWIARRTAQSSDFGARFDMETDALAALVLCVVLWRAGLADAWILLIGALRYIFVAAGWLLAWLRHPLPPSQRRRAVCAAQGALLASCLVPLLPPAGPPVLGAIALAATAYSFLVDTVWLWRRAAA